MSSKIGQLKEALIRRKEENTADSSTFFYRFKYPIFGGFAALIIAALIWQLSSSSQTKISGADNLTTKQPVTTLPAVIQTSPIPSPVSHSKKSGLYDMNGNVSEWCLDTWAPYPGCSKPKQREINRRVLRGGSWCNDYVVCRSAYRCWDYEAGRSYNIGFRLAQD